MRLTTKKASLRGLSIGLILGFSMGILYAVGGFFFDLFTTGLNLGTALAFMALLGMPLIFGLSGCILAVLVHWLGILIRGHIKD